MNDLLERIRGLVRQRNLRERWLVALALCTVALLLVQSLWVGPLRSRARRLEKEGELLEEQIQLAGRLSPNVRLLQSELAKVEQLIAASRKSDLLTLLETLATRAGLTQEQIDSVTPKPSSPSPDYPETRVEVRLKGATLSQMVDFLYRIENASQHLIVRSLKITTRGKERQALDVSFSVSSFEQA